MTRLTTAAIAVSVICSLFATPVGSQQRQSTDASRIHRSVAELRIEPEHGQRLANDSELLLARIGQLDRMTSEAHGSGPPGGIDSYRAEAELWQHYVQSAAQLSATLNAALDDRGLQHVYRAMLDELWYRGLLTEAGVTLRQAASGRMEDDGDVERRFAEQGIEVAEAARHGKTFLETEGKGKRWLERGPAAPAAHPDTSAPDVTMTHPVLPSSAPPWQGVPLGPINEHRITSLLTQSPPPVVTALASEIVPQAIQQLTLGVSVAPTTTPDHMEPISGWCCHLGLVRDDVDEACCASVGGWFETDPGAAQFRCDEFEAQGDDERLRLHEPTNPYESGDEAHGWCCVHGEVVPAPEHDCIDHGGRFFMHAEEAQMHCLDAERRGGELHESVQPDGRVEREGDWCCIDGRLFHGVAHDCCQSLSGLAFIDEHVARRQCGTDR